MNLWSITDRGSVRRDNQDACRTGFVHEGLGLGVVCDGMGGALAGNVASALAIEAFWEAAAARCAQGLPEDPGQMLGEAVVACNKTVYRRSREDEACTGMGTTLVAALCDGTRAWVVNVGDSRCYVAGPESIRQVSRDHSLVETLVARGEITPDQARSHPHKNLITRALGVEPGVTADFYTIECLAGDFLLLCSDGLSNQAASEELYQTIRGGPPEESCQRLLDLALSRGAPDNVTAVLFQM